MNYPIGEYYCKLDAKGRLLFPSGFKEQLGEALEAGFVLRPGLFETCLDVYGMDDWRKLQEKKRSTASAEREIRLKRDSRNTIAPPAPAPV